MSVKSGDDIGTIIIKLENRLSELEASSASHTEALANRNDGLNKFFKNYKKEIAELREEVDAWADGQRIGVRQLDELKEEDKRLYNTIIDSSNEDYKQIKEVLRELGKEMKAFRDDEGYGTYSVDKILAKLDGSGSEMTHKEAAQYERNHLDEFDEKPPEPREDAFLVSDSITRIREYKDGGELNTFYDGKVYDIVKREELENYKAIIETCYHNHVKGSYKELVYRNWEKLKNTLQGERLSDATDGGV